MTWLGCAAESSMVIDAAPSRVMRDAPRDCFKVIDYGEWLALTVPRVKFFWSATVLRCDTVVALVIPAAICCPELLSKVMCLSALLVSFKFEKYVSATVRCLFRWIFLCKASRFVNSLMIWLRWTAVSGELLESRPLFCYCNCYWVALIVVYYLLLLSFLTVLQGLSFLLAAPGGV